MAVQISRHLFAALEELRYEPTAKRVRALLGAETVVDTTRAVLVWEPQRVVPQYAVPEQDVLAELVAGRPGDGATEGGPVRLGSGGPLVLTPEAGFGVHSSDGEVLTVRVAGSEVRVAGSERPGAGFRPADPGLAGYIVLDFAAFDEWREEDERIVSHPRDPFARIDVRRSTRQVRVERDGHVLAESTRSRLLFETHLPVRFYLPREDVRTELLKPSDTVTTCAYKGEAAYWSLQLDGQTVPDIAWSYPQPLADSAEIRDLVCFFDERVDVVVDGVPRERPQSPWS